MVKHVAKVGRFTVEFSFADGQMQCMWDPHAPKRGDITKDDLADYVAARDRWLDALAKAIGRNVLIIDV